jgi:hypothetical protein
VHPIDFSNEGFFGVWQARRHRGCCRAVNKILQGPNVLFCAPNRDQMAYSAGQAAPGLLLRAFNRVGMGRHHMMALLAVHPFGRRWDDPLAFEAAFDGSSGFRLDNSYYRCACAVSSEAGSRYFTEDPIIGCQMRTKCPILHAKQDQTVLLVSDMTSRGSDSTPRSARGLGFGLDSPHRRFPTRPLQKDRQTGPTGYGSCICALPRLLPRSPILVFAGHK